jgi:Zn-finger nucleic acid-binding protein
VCRTRLAAAVLDDAYAVQYCTGCRGVLLARGAFADVVQNRRAWVADPPGPAVPLRKDELTRAVVCPKCGRRFDTHPYYGPGNVVIDSCGACELIWLDFGELKQIVDAPGRDRGLREKAGRPTTPMQDPTTTRAIGGSPDPADRGTDFIDVIADLLSN